MPELATRAETAADLHAQVTDLIWHTRDLQMSRQSLAETAEYWREVALQERERAERLQQRLDGVLSMLLDDPVAEREAF